MSVDSGQYADDTKFNFRNFNNPLYADDFDDDGVVATDEPTFTQMQPPKPLQIKVVNESIIPFESVLIPPELAQYVQTIAFETQTAREAITLATLQMVSSVADIRIGIFAKQYKHWCVMPTMWTIIAARSGMRKSAIDDHIGTLIAPILERYEIENAQAAEEFANNCDLLQNEISALEVLLKRQPNSQETIEALTSKQAELRDVKTRGVLIKRLVTSDATIEKLQDVLVISQRGITLLKDELSDLFISMLKPARTNDKTFYLTAFNNVKPYPFDRVNRGSQVIKHLSIGICGFIQNSVLKRTVHQMIERTGHDGFFSRFIPIFLSRVDYDGSDVPLNEAAVLEIQKKLDWLEQWKPALEDYRTVKMYGTVFPGVQFGTQAQQLFDSFEMDMEREIDAMGKQAEERPDDMYLNAFLDNISKFKTVVLKLSLTFHLLKHAGENIPPKVDVITLLRALSWVEYLRPQIAQLYQPPAAKKGSKPAAVANVTTDVDVASKLLKKIASGAIKDGDTAASVKNNGWSGMKDKEQLESALELLAEHGWINYLESKIGNFGGISSKKITVTLNAKHFLNDESYFTEIVSQNTNSSNYTNRLKRLLQQVSESNVDVLTGNLLSSIQF
jgi:hypothetical protein